METDGMPIPIYCGRHICSLVVLGLSIGMVFSCRHTGFFKWTATPKRSASDAADGAIFSAQAGTYDLCVEFTNQEFCYPIAAFTLVDVASSLFLALSFILLAVSLSRGQGNVARRFCQYSLRVQAVGLCTALLSFLFAVVIYVVSVVHLQGGRLASGFSFKGGWANLALSSVALAGFPLYKLFNRRNNPFSDRHAVDNQSQLSGWALEEKRGRNNSFSDRHAFDDQSQSRDWPMQERH